MQLPVTAGLHASTSSSHNRHSASRGAQHNFSSQTHCLAGGSFSSSLSLPLPPSASSQEGMSALAVPSVSSRNTMTLSSSESRLFRWQMGLQAGQGASEMSEQATKVTSVRRRQPALEPLRVCMVCPYNSLPGATSPILCRCMALSQPIVTTKPTLMACPLLQWPRAVKGTAGSRQAKQLGAADCKCLGALNLQILSTVATDD